jgi:hypothetical protein
MALTCWWEEPSTALKADIAEVVITTIAATANLPREGFDEAGPIPKTGQVSHDQPLAGLLPYEVARLFCPIV